MSDSPTDPSEFDGKIVDVLLAWQSLEIASRHVREESANRAGISPKDFQALVFLAAENGTAPKTIGQKLGLSTGAITALIDRLDNAGYLTREPHPTDRRSMRLMLTPAGFSAVTVTGTRFVDAATHIIPTSDLQGVTELFTQLATALTEPAPPSDTTEQAR